MGTGSEGNELGEREEIGKNFFMIRVVDEWSKLRCVVEANTTVILNEDDTYLWMGKEFDE